MRLFIPLFLSAPIIVGAFTPSHGPSFLVRQHTHKIGTPLYSADDEVAASDGPANDDHKEQHDIVKDYRAGMSDSRNPDADEKVRGLEYFFFNVIPLSI